MPGSTPIGSSPVGGAAGEGGSSFSFLKIGFTLFICKYLNRTMYFRERITNE
jgi:hypothetical protein